MRVSVPADGAKRIGVIVVTAGRRRAEQAAAIVRAMVARETRTGKST
jgi:hypothetical protein